MTKYINNSRVLAFISGLLYTFAVFHIVFILAWICLIPLFIAVNKKSTKEFVWAGLMFGLAISLAVFTSMINGAVTFTGGGFIYGFFAFLVSMVVSLLYYGILLALLARIRLISTNSILFAGIIVASLWVVFEFVLTIPLTGMPWFNRHSAHALIGNLYTIQPAALFGEHILTFIMILVNYLFAQLLLQGKWKKLIFPVGLVAAYFVLGVLMQKSFEEKNTSTKDSFKLAIVSENIPPETKWNDRTGNKLVENLLTLNKRAVSWKPDIILWSESAIPWTYSPDDDLINEIRRVSNPAGITHLLGMNTAYQGNKLFNSVYCLLPDSEKVSRYDKCNALDFIEKPFANLLVPFFSEDGSTVQEGKDPIPLITPYGKAGVMICNESFIPKAAAIMVKNGAEFFVNPGNDGWFRKTAIVRQHFYATRLRAVETRKDFVVNSNNGISGLIQASGRIAAAKQEEESYVELVTVTPNTRLSLFTKYPYLWIYTCIAVLICAVCFRYFLPIIKKKI